MNSLSSVAVAADVRNLSGGGPEEYFTRGLASSDPRGDHSGMPCLVGCFALFFPRLAIILIWLFSNYLKGPYQPVHVIWPVLGFFLMPLTVLAYALAWHVGGGRVDGIGIVLIILAALFDLGILGGSASHKDVRRYYRRR